MQLCWNHTFAWVFSCKFAAYFQNTFSYEHLWVAASIQHHHALWTMANLSIITIVLVPIQRKKRFYFSSHLTMPKDTHPANIYLFKVSNRNTRKRCKICSKFTMLVTFLFWAYYAYNMLKVIESVVITWLQNQKGPTLSDSVVFKIQSRVKIAA